ncbi:MAG: hypothetical protein NC417_01640 [Candidatus Gastranaerophilales bacterium]|nr:hypothetical protein [Candidatus Gastranaerophilales bacterium]
MGGEAPHLGLVLTEGALGGYSVQRDLSRISNDRGDFILHPSPVSLAPKESFTISWTLFWHNGIDDFYDKLKRYNKRYIEVCAENYIVFEGETCKLDVRPHFAFADQDVVIMENGRLLSFARSDQKISITETLPVGEHTYDIQIGETKTSCKILVLPPPEILAKSRCHFIVQKQQYNRPNSRLHGAYLIYDNEEKHMYYSNVSDYNGGRERIGMGLLLARYLQSHEDQMLLESLNRYVDYVERELFHTETGEVYNDCGRNNEWNRLYNYPWFSTFFIELYRLKKEKEMLRYAYLALRSYYEQGGESFYAIEIPVCEMMRCLDGEGMSEEKEILLGYFEKHCEQLVKNGTNYPTSEVNYEQSIVAPAADILLQVYEVTGDGKYLDAAKAQIMALELFNGLQPDFHLYETAIRHWDGYWFGKRRMYGDTFPHYWSALTANVYARYAYLMGDEKYAKKAKAAHRSVLSLFRPDGSASCAYVYPVSVNGERAGYYDSYANDQDWGLYFMIRDMQMQKDMLKC